MTTSVTEAWVRDLVDGGFWSLEYEVQVLRPLSFRDPVCSVARGQLGERFRQLRCLTGAAECAGCGQREGCDFARYLDAGQDGATPWYWLQGLPAHLQLAEGERLRVRLSTVGAASPVPPYFEAAMRDALLRLGAPPVSGAAWQPSLKVETLPVRRRAALTVRPSRRWRFRFRTPVILKGTESWGAERCPEAPVFAALAQGAVRRLFRLASLTGPTPARYELPDLRGVRLVEGGLSPWQGARMSHRRGSLMPITGETGEIVVEGGVLEELSPLLSLLPLMNLGKLTTMGFGWVEARPDDE